MDDDKSLTIAERIRDRMESTGDTRLLPSEKDMATGKVANEYGMTYRFRDGSTGFIRDKVGSPFEVDSPYASIFPPSAKTYEEYQATAMLLGVTYHAWCNLFFSGAKALDADTLEPLDHNEIAKRATESYSIKSRAELMEMPIFQRKWELAGQRGKR